MGARLGTKVVDDYAALSSVTSAIVDDYREVRRGWDRFALLDPSLGSRLSLNSEFTGGVLGGSGDFSKHIFEGMARDQAALKALTLDEVVQLNGLLRKILHSLGE